MNLRLRHYRTRRDAPEPAIVLAKYSLTAEQSVTSAICQATWSGAAPPHSISARTGVASRQGRSTRAKLAPRRANARAVARPSPRAARERLTLIRIFEELCALGYAGSYAAVRRYAIAWREKRVGATAAAYVPLTFAPGEAYQFDWSHEIVVMDGVTTIVKVAHVRLCHSRMMLARAYPRETQEMGLTPTSGRSHSSGRLHARHLRQHEDGGGDDPRRQAPAIQSPLPPDVLASSCRARRLHASVGLGERSSREAGRPRSRALLHAALAGQEL